MKGNPPSDAPGLFAPARSGLRRPPVSARRPFSGPSGPARPISLSRPRRLLLPMGPISLLRRLRWPASATSPKIIGHASQFRNPGRWRAARPVRALLAAVLVVAWGAIAHADEARPGSVEWSDGRTAAGAISLTPGRQLLVFTATGQVSFSLAEVKEIRFTPEKEEMRQGFYFPDAGQATQVKTGEVYPVRYLQTQVTLANGQSVEGHLFTTAFYLESDDGTEKVVVMAKQTGADGQKLADLAYPMLIRLDAAAGAGSAHIDLTQAGFVPLHPPVFIARPDLAAPPVQPAAGKPVWTAPVDPGQLLFSVEAVDGIHVAWPKAQADPQAKTAVEASLKVMQDFYDTRTLLGCFADGTDVYSLVMMKRLGATYDYSADKIPWSLVVLRWKYDPATKRATLLNRVMLGMGRQQGNVATPKVLIEPELLRDVTAGR
jgi:hypothetical protein